MKMSSFFIAIVAAANMQRASADEANPIGKVLQLLSDLQTKIIGEGEADLQTKIRGGEVLTSDEVKFLRKASRHRLRCDLYTTPVAFTQGVWRDCLPS